MRQEMYDAGQAGPVGVVYPAASAPVHIFRRARFMQADKGVSAMRESPQLSAALRSAPVDLRFCLDCSLAICADRLRAVPRALRCLDCQDRYEAALLERETQSRQHH